MELFFALVGFMVILALIRLWKGMNHSKDHRTGSNEHSHYWIHHDPGISNGGGGTESGGGSFDGGSSDGGGGDSSGF